MTEHVRQCEFGNEKDTTRIEEEESRRHRTGGGVHHAAHPSPPSSLYSTSYYRCWERKARLSGSVRSCHPTYIINTKKTKLGVKSRLMPVLGIKSTPIGLGSNLC